MIIEMKTEGFYFRPIGCEESHTEKTQSRKFETNIPRKGIARPQS
jgi:hypothetical protein